MLNVFYLSGGMWFIVLFLYSLGWADICIPLSDSTVFFVLFMIVSSIVLGYVLRKHFKFKKIQQNPHKHCTITLILVAFYVVNLLYARSIPLLNVLRGQPKGVFSGIPTLSFVVSGFIFIYCFYLAYLFVCFKQKKILLEFLVTYMYFILLFERQNIIIIFLAFMWIWLASINFKKLPGSVKALCVICMTILILIALYVFGIMGNSRYGIWDSTDASMITELGKINDKFPSFIPKSYAWAYIYAVSPLSNLQYNINLGVAASNSTTDILREFLPNFIFKRMVTGGAVVSELLVSSLTACTAFSDVYRAGGGFFGMITLYFCEVLWVVFLIKLFNKNDVYRTPAYVSAIYFFLLSFFDNPIRYDMTSLIIVYQIIFGFYLLCKRSLVVGERGRMRQAAKNAVER